MSSTPSRSGPAALCLALLLPPADARALAPMSGGIVYSSDRTGTAQLWLQERAGAAPRRLTRSTREERHPHVSPDGTRIVFTAVVGGRSDLHLLELASGEVTRRTQGGSDREPAWSPDGTHIAFTSGRDGDSALFVLRVEDGSTRRISASGARERGPCFSPDGKLLAHSGEVDGDEEIFVRDLEGGPPRRLTRHPGPDSGPSWSPDGSTLAFSSSRDGRHDDIVLLDVSSGARRGLTSNQELRQEFLDRNVANWGPVFSPDGSEVLFNSLRDGDAEVYAVRVEGGGLRRWTQDDGHDLDPCWLPARD